VRRLQRSRRQWLEQQAPAVCSDPAVAARFRSPLADMPVPLIVVLGAQLVVFAAMMVGAAAPGGWAGLGARWHPSLAVARRAWPSLPSCTQPS